MARRLSTWLLVVLLAAGGYGGWHWWTHRDVGIPSATLATGLLSSNYDGFGRLTKNSDILLIYKMAPEAYTEVGLHQPQCPLISVPQKLHNRATAAYFGTESGTLYEAIYSGAKADVSRVWSEMEVRANSCLTVNVPSGIQSFDFDVWARSIPAGPLIIDHGGEGRGGWLASQLYMDLSSALVGDRCIVTFLWVGVPSNTQNAMDARSHALDQVTKALGLPRSAAGD